MQRSLIDGRYVVERFLGGGGMAQVYLAHDEVLERDVALKVLKDRYAGDQEFVERFRCEARSAASLSHPNIVSIFDRGLSEDGAYYIAMEHVPGGTLRERIRREGALPPGEAIRVAERIADALSAAHERGVIHRDIKSQNVLVTRKGGVKVTDFGIARAASSASSGATAQGLVLGTADYMSPEQARGEPVGPQTDLYSLGVVLYEMLTGNLPYRAESPIGAATRHVTEPVPSPREVDPGVPEPLAALTTKLLAKDPEKRYPSAAALAADLRRLGADLPPDAGATERMTVPLPPLPPGREGHTRTTAVQPPVAAPSRAPGHAGKGRGKLLLALLALFAGTIVLGGIIWGSTRDATDRSGAEGDGGPVRVPDLTYAETAEEELAAVGLELGRRDEVPSDKVPVGVVSDQDPVEGTEVERGTAVDVKVSTGPKQAPDGGEKRKEKKEEGDRREKKQGDGRRR